MNTTWLAFLGVMGLAVLPLSADSPECPAMAKVPAVLAGIHARQWERLTPNDIDGLLGTKLERIDAEIPLGSQYRTECSDVLYLVQTSGSCKLTFVFTKAKVGDTCKATLETVSFTSEMPNRVAQPLIADVLEAVRPGGLPDGSSELHYTWRSDDSRYRFDLVTIVTPHSQNPNPATMASVKVLLDQKAVAPNEVDDLPFHKGYFPPKCGPTKK